jgi:nicotinamidase/pyrazinamidase
MNAKLTPRTEDALVVIDVQNDFCPGGALAVPGGDAIVPLVNRLAKRFAHVVLTQDWHPGGHSSFASSHPGREPFQAVRLAYGEQTLWPDHCVQGTRGAEFHSGLELTGGELVLRKGFRAGIDSYSAFRENDRTTRTGLAGYLRERGFRRLVMCGLALDFCVGWSAIDGSGEGFEVVVVEDARWSIDLAAAAAARKAMLKQSTLLRSEELADLNEEQMPAIVTGAILDVLASCHLELAPLAPSLTGAGAGERLDPSYTNDLPGGRNRE